MHYYLADKETKRIDPGARALLLDTAGNISEASTASVFIYRQRRGLAAPPEEKILPGISLSVVKELAGSLDLPFEHCDLTPDDVAYADEVMLCSTSPCLLPVLKLHGRPIAEGIPGHTYRALLQSWISMIGLDVPSQARQFANR